MDAEAIINVFIRDTDQSLGLTVRQVETLIGYLEKEINKRHALIIKLEMALEELQRR